MLGDVPSLYWILVSGILENILSASGTQKVLLASAEGIVAKVFCIWLGVEGLKPNVEYLNLKYFCLPLSEIYSCASLAPTLKRTGKANVVHG